MKKMIFLFYVVFIFMSCEEEGRAIIDPPVPLWTDFESSFSKDGNFIAYYHSKRDTVDTSGIHIINKDGTNRKFMIYSGGNPSWFPDGEWLAIDQLGDGQIYKINTTTRQKILLTTGSNRKFFPAVSPDGSRIAFSIDDGPFQERGIWVVNSDGTNMKLLINTSSSKPTGIQPAWSPLGNEIAFVGWRDTRGSFLQIYDTLSGKVKSIMEHKKRGIKNIKFSSDGSNLIFQLEASDVGDEIEIWVINRDGKDLKKIKTCGASPTWSVDRKKIVYTKYSFHNPKKGNGYLWIMNADGSGDKQLTF